MELFYDACLVGTIIPHKVLSVRSAPQNSCYSLFIGQHCLWDSEEQEWEWTAQLICSSFLYGTRLPLGQRGAKQRKDIPFHSLSCSSLSQRQSRPIQKWGADQLYSPFSVMLLAVPEAVLSHTKVWRISSRWVLCIFQLWLQHSVLFLHMNTES